jgi:hypothetical protein
MTQAAAQRSLRRRVAGVRPRRVGASRDRLTPHERVIWAILAVAFVFYLWTAGTSAPLVVSGPSTDPYNLLTTAFLHGHTYLPVTIPAGLLHLANPYDPAQNAPYQAAFHDLSFRNGHLYSPWGPTPVFTLFMPFRLTGLTMPEGFAVFLYSFIGLVCAVKLMHLLVRRFVPDTPNWLLAVATAGLALTNVVPFMLRRPAQYEVAISSGYCFEMAGILLVVSSLLKPRFSFWRMSAGSLCLGLAVGGRLSLLAGALVLVLAAVLMIRKGASRRVLLPILAPIVVCGLLLAAYNAARFGSISDFGERYQLAGLNQSTMPADQLSYLPPGLFSYLLMPARLAITFPHVFLMTTANYPGPFPSGYAGSPGGWPAEPAGGLLPTMPITLLLLAAPLLWRRRREGERSALLIVAGLAGLGLVIMVLLALALWATTQRYEVDYASEFLIAAMIVWALLTVRFRERRKARRVIAGTGIVLTLIGAGIGTAVSFTGYYDGLRIADPTAFHQLEDLTSPLATLATMIAGKPVIARVSGPLPTDLPPQGLGTFDEGGAGTWLGDGPVEVVVIAPSGGRLTLVAGVRLGPAVAANTPLAVRATSGGAALINGPRLTLPIRVHLGLNRIRLDLLGGVGASPEKLYLDHIVVRG